MAGPDYGALGGTFKIVRILQVISLLSIIGMAANLISGMVSLNYTPSDVVVGTLSVVCCVPSSDLAVCSFHPPDVYIGALLCYYLHSVHRPYSSLPDHHWSGRRSAYRLDRGSDRGREAALLPQLSNRWDR